MSRPTHTEQRTDRAIIDAAAETLIRKTLAKSYEAGHLAGYRRAYDDLCDKPLLIRTGKPYRLSGPDGTWYVIGLNTAGDEAELLLVTEDEYERRMARRKETKPQPHREYIAVDGGDRG